MHTRFKIAATALALWGIFVVGWRGLADRRTAIDNAACNIADPHSSCDGPKLGIGAARGLRERPPGQRLRQRSADREPSARLEKRAP